MKGSMGWGNCRYLDDGEDFSYGWEQYEKVHRLYNALPGTSMQEKKARFKGSFGSKAEGWCRLAGTFYWMHICFNDSLRTGTKKKRD